MSISHAISNLQTDIQRASASQRLKRILDQRGIRIAVDSDVDLGRGRSSSNRGDLGKLRRGHLDAGGHGDVAGTEAFDIADV